MTCTIFFSSKQANGRMNLSEECVFRNLFTIIFSLKINLSMPHTVKDKFSDFL